MKKTIDCSDLVGTYTLNEMPQLLKTLQERIDTIKPKRKKEDLEYLKIRIYENGKVDSVKSTKSEYDIRQGSLYSLTSPNKINYDFFITTNYNLRKDCKKHLNKMLKELDSEQKVLDKKREQINKMISNSKEL